MHTALTSEQIASYRENGYLAVYNLLDETELATWRQAVDQAVADTIAKDSASHDIRHNQTGEGYYQQVFMQCVNLWKSHATVKA